MKKKSEKIVELPGMTGPGVGKVKIAEIDKAAGQYVRERDRRMTEGKREKQSKVKLIDLLTKHAEKIGRDKDGTIVYRYEDEIVVLSPGMPDLKVKHVSTGDNDAE